VPMHCSEFNVGGLGRMTGANWAFRFQRLTFPGPRGTILLRFSFFADRFHWLLQSLHTV
jgi:hypothetical protein